MHQHPDVARLLVDERQAELRAWRPGRRRDRGSSPRSTSLSGAIALLRWAARLPGAAGRRRRRLRGGAPALVPSSDGCT